MLNIHVVPESYIETCKNPKEDPVENIVKLSICSWGRNVSVFFQFHLTLLSIK
jgi:hypothetical protein